MHMKQNNLNIASEGIMSMTGGKWIIVPPGLQEQLLQ